MHYKEERMGPENIVKLYEATTTEKTDKGTISMVELGDKNAT